MYTLVLVEGRALAKAAATVSTAVRLLASVDPQVSGDSQVLCEGPAIIRAAVGPLPLVDGPVLAQGRSSAKALAAVRALERLLACMCVEMLHECGAPGKTLSTHTAGMTLVCSKDRRVGSERRAAPGMHFGGRLHATREANRGGLGALQPRRPRVRRECLLPCFSLFLFFFLISRIWPEEGAEPRAASW